MDSLRICFLLSSVATILYLSGFVVNAEVAVGINYGLLGDNLPPPSEVVGLFKQYNVKKVRIFDPNPDVLNALRNSGIEVIVGMKNQDLESLAASQGAVNDWFGNNIQPYLSDVKISTITIGNEVIPGDLGSHVLPVMQKLHSQIKSNNLEISLSTTLAAENLGQSYPPSAASFTDQSRQQLVPLLNFLKEIGSPLLVNIYPYFPYADDPKNVQLEYAQFTASQPIVRDGELSYYNLLDAVLDSFVYAMEKEGVYGVPLGVTESGWPSAGNGELTTPSLAQTYNQNFAAHIAKCAGTPKRPNICLEAYIFAMFNENQKPGGTEQNFGLLYPDKTPVYNFF